MKPLQEAQIKAVEMLDAIAARKGPEYALLIKSMAECKAVVATIGGVNGEMAEGIGLIMCDLAGICYALLERTGVKINMKEAEIEIDMLYSLIKTYIKATDR